MATTPVAGYMGQVQIAPNSSGSPGTWAALSEGSKATPGHKRANQDVSLLGAGPGHRRVATLGDLDLKLEHFWDSGDVALTSLLNSLTNQDRVFARVFRNATAYKQAPMLVESLQVESEPSAIAKVSTSLLLDASLAAPSESTGSLLTPATMPAPVAAYKSLCSIGTGSTTLTGGACTQIGATKSYQITSTAHRWLDPTVAVVVKDNGTPVTAASGNLIAVDMQFGIATFANSYSPAGPVTIDGAYLTVSPLQWIKKLSSTLKLDLQDITDLNSAGWIKRAPTAIDYTVAFDVEDVQSSDPQSGGSNVGTNSWTAFVSGGIPIPIEHDPDGTQTTVIRSWMLLDSDTEPVEFGKIVQQSFSGSLASRTNGIYNAAWSIGTP